MNRSYLCLLVLYGLHTEGSFFDKKQQMLRFMLVYFRLGRNKTIFLSLVLFGLSINSKLNEGENETQMFLFLFF